MNRQIGTYCVIALLTSLLLVGCSPRVDERGIKLDAESLAAVKVGQTRSEVVKILGNPSTISTFNEQNWYYLSRRTVTWAFLPAHATDQNVVVVSFDRAGLVSKVTQREGFAENLAVSPTRRITPSKGHSYGLVEDFLGNLGRFNNKTGR
ncbi:MAG: outer membrane protein assembly factor BamE [Alphaproteobacteria bacterium]|nr:outer membrane protein assembly factor BamE [Alphaproteobacteria bacterium]